MPIAVPGFLWLRLLWLFRGWLFIFIQATKAVVGDRVEKERFCGFVSLFSNLHPTKGAQNSAG